MRISDWSSDVCSSDVAPLQPVRRKNFPGPQAGLLADASLQILPPPRSSTAFRPLRCARGDEGRLAVSERRAIAGRSCDSRERRHIMALTLGPFPKLDDGPFTGPPKPPNPTPT